MRGAEGSRGANFSRSFRASGSSPQGVDLIMYFCIFCCSSAILLIMINLYIGFIQSYFLYSMNSWNLKNFNSKLSILQKTEAHRKHLLNLVSVKSCVNTRNILRPKIHIKGSIDLLQQKQVSKNNQSMIQRIVKISKSHSDSRSSLSSRSLSRNLKTYSSLSRTIRTKEIQKQNQKLYSRLLVASPTIKRRQWIKRNIQTAKYKENLHQGKYICPDYSQEACKALGRLPKFRSVKTFNKTTERGKIYKLPRQF